MPMFNLKLANKRNCIAIDYEINGVSPISIDIYKILKDIEFFIIKIKRFLQSTNHENSTSPFTTRK